MAKLDKLALEEVVDLLEKKDFKKKLIKVLNKNIDVPIFNEKTEAKVLDTFYNLLLKTIKDMADE